MACTPESVRPEPWISSLAPKKSSAALRSWPCTVRALFCSCQPLYLVPSYSSVIFQVFNVSSIPKCTPGRWCYDERSEEGNVQRVQRIHHAWKRAGHGGGHHHWRCVRQDCDIPGERYFDAAHWGTARSGGLQEYLHR